MVGLGRGWPGPCRTRPAEPVPGHEDGASEAVTTTTQPRGSTRWPAVRSLAILALRLEHLTDLELDLGPILARVDPRLRLEWETLGPFDGLIHRLHL